MSKAEAKRRGSAKPESLSTSFFSEETLRDSGFILRGIRKIKAVYIPPGLHVNGLITFGGYSSILAWGLFMFSMHSLNLGDTKGNPPLASLW